MMTSCSSQKDTVPARAMQNITAKYNYLYNANVLLSRYEANIKENLLLHDLQILPVHATGEPNIQDIKDLDQVITKAKTVIAEKSYSKHIASTYLLLAKAYFYKGNYFLAQEYADYVVSTHAKNSLLYSNGLDLKARSLMQLGKYAAAQPVLDSLEASTKAIKKHKASGLATLAQSKIEAEKYDAAIVYLEAALKKGAAPQQEIRWNFILAQLYQAENNFQKAIHYYKKVEKRNAAFELAFQASLNQIKMKSLLDHDNFDQQKQLLTLLKADKNQEFKDQVYHQLALVATEKLNINAAVNYEKQSLRANTTNQIQKGLSYLHLSDLHYHHLKNHQQASLYHDSALVNLPENYSHYTILSKRNKHLQFLARQYKVIADEEKLQDTSSQVQKVGSGTLAASNEKLFNYYYDLATFYTQELKDQKQASVVDQLLRDRFAGALLIKNRELMHNKAKLAREAVFLQQYNQVYDRYERKDYPQVIEAVNQLSASNGAHPFSAQLAYLKALTIGNLYPVDSLISAFASNSRLFAQDSLIGPLVKQHLAYIQQHLPALKKRSVAILATDPAASFQQELSETQLKALPLVAVEDENSITALKTEVVKVESIFSNRPSDTYYYVIAVNDATVNLSSSRFGIGQFNRGNYAAQELKHRLVEFDDYQLIYVGNFSNFEQIEIYADGITPQLQRIMKVPAASYVNFIISKENLEKIDNTDLLNEYLKYYKNNF
jgi:hypothetical protein